MRGNRPRLRDDKEGDREEKSYRRRASDPGPTPRFPRTTAVPAARSPTARRTTRALCSPLGPAACSPLCPPENTAGNCLDAPRDWGDHRDLLDRPAPRGTRSRESSIAALVGMAGTRLIARRGSGVAATRRFYCVRSTSTTTSMRWDEMRSVPSFPVVSVPIGYDRYRTVTFGAAWMGLASIGYGRF